MSFLRKLFGLGGSAVPASEKPTATQEHAGFVIRATPMSEGGQFQVCGVIACEVDGTAREYRFIRVDRFANRDDAVSMIFQKGRQIIDERGLKVFD
jgi:hypothetical protein